MFLLGLTGGIASGKSTVSRRLAERGAIVIDADQVARDVVAPGTPGLAAVAHEFGTRVLNPDGSLDRAALGGLVFADRELLAKLNAIIHPLVKMETSARIHRQANDAIVVYDVPLLVEAAVDHPFDLIVVVQASADIRKRRLIEERGMSAVDAEARIRSQASDDERLARADVVINTDGSIDETLAQADRLWHRVCTQFTDASRSI